MPVLIGGLIAAGGLAESGAPGWAAWVAGVAAVAIFLGGGFVWPLLRWRTWRYEVRDEEIDLLRGALVVTRTLVPMTRVQHVDTQRNPVADLFDLRSVERPHGRRLARHPGPAAGGGHGHPRPHRAAGAHPR